MRTAAVLVALTFSPVAVTQEAGGHTYTGDGFKVRFPGEPKADTQTAKTAVGSLKVRTATYATADGNVFLVSSTEFPTGAIQPGDLGRLYDGVRDGLKGKDGKVVSEKDVTVGKDKLAGREVVIDKGKQQTRFRVVAKGTRLYQAAAVGAGPFVTGADATAFLDSFEPAQ